MKRSGSNRVARKIGSYDDEESTESAESSLKQGQKPAVVKRPTIGKTKKRSSLRISFGPGEGAEDGGDSSDAAAKTPKKANLSRIALEKSAQLRAQSPLVPENARPTEYSKDYIAELRNSTPSTPKDLRSSTDEDESVQALDVASKFGSISSIETPSAIPTEAEIKEKKARRKRLAQQESAFDEEEDRPWASDDEGEDEFRQHRNEISLRPKEKWCETRLVHDDEDIAEGFDDFVEDGKISLGRKSEKEAQRRKRAEMAELINDAEGGSDDAESADSEEERNNAFVAAQARAGRYGQNLKDVEDDGSKTPPRIAPLPDLDDILENLTIDIRSKQKRKAQVLAKLQELKDDKLRIEERKTYLQEQLQKTGDEYEKLRQEAGLPALPAAEGGRLITERGLDSLGTTPLAGRSSEDSDMES